MEIFPQESVIRTVERWYSARPESLFEAYEDPDKLRAWVGPRSIVKWLKFDHCLRNGGALVFGFTQRDGSEVWGRCDFIDVNPGSRIEYVSSFTDPGGTIVPPVPERNWLMQVHTAVSFTASNGGTIFRVTAQPSNAADEERAFFAYKWPETKMRFEASFDVLENLLSYTTANEFN